LETASLKTGYNLKQGELRESFEQDLFRLRLPQHRYLCPVIIKKNTVESHK
jgi:hypothetical protein